MAVSDFSDDPQAESDEARIEIVPLIDIMFFLLAAFILITMGAVRLKLHSVKLPTAVAASKSKADTPPLSLAVDKSGALRLEGRPVAPAELTEELDRRRRADPALRVVVAADKDTLHAFVVRALDAARRAGVEQIAFAVTPES